MAELVECLGELSNKRTAVGRVELLAEKLGALLIAELDETRGGQRSAFPITLVERRGDGEVSLVAGEGSEMGKGGRTEVDGIEGEDEGNGIVAAVEVVALGIELRQLQGMTSQRRGVIGEAVVCDTYVSRLLSDRATA